MIPDARRLLAVPVVLATISCARPIDQIQVTPAPTPSHASIASPRLAATTAPSTNPNSADAPGGTFTYKPAAVSFNWPAGWVTTTIEDYPWSIVPTDDKSAAVRWIALDVPKLPWHPPGMIPIGRVESGYLDDLKKQFGKLDIKELSPPKLPNAKDRLVRAAWQKDGKSMEQTALLIVDDDHVYIFRGRSDTDHERPTSDAFNSVTSSIQWTKR